MFTLARSLSITCLSFGLLASCVADEADVGEDLLARESEGIVQPVSMQPALDERGDPIPGTLVFETSEGRLDITHLVPDRPREFASNEAFHEFLIRELNGRLVEHEDGQRSSTVEYTAATTLRYDPRIDDLVIVDDPLDAIIGGTDGYIVIAGEQVCTSRAAECADKAGLTRPVERDRRIVPAVVQGSSGPLGIRGLTWVAASSLVRWVGSSTTQTSGTAGLGWVACWSGGPSWCYGWRGSNFLSTAYRAQLPPFLPFSGAAVASNTLHVMAGRFDFIPAPASHFTRTCSTHVGVSGPDAVVLQSGFGLYDCRSTTAEPQPTLRQGTHEASIVRRHRPADDGMCASHAGHDGAHPHQLQTSTGYTGSGCGP